MSQVSIRKTSEPIVQLFGYPHSVVFIHATDVHAVISQPFATFYCHFSNKLNTKNYNENSEQYISSREINIEPKLLNRKRENSKIYQTKMARKKSQF